MKPKHTTQRDVTNNSDPTLTPDGLRKLAVPHATREASCEPTEFQIHRLSARLSSEQIRDVVRRYEGRESARALAAEYDVATSALIRLLRERNIVVRRQTITPKQAELMAREYEAGKTMAELEKQHGISHRAVLRALHRSGVEMRAKTPRKKSV